MNGAVYLVREGEELVPVAETPYDSEGLLQELLAKHPGLLAGEQVASTPRRWLLVRRESGSSSEPEASGRWAVDHLFLDQDGVPTLVEVKRSSDTRLRREVVGQMLDYAANAVSFWPVERIRAEFEATCSVKGEDPDVEIVELVGAESDPEAFWTNVKTNLKAGRIRLVFVADTIANELVRVVEFLNSQMDPAEVLAIEVRQFQGEGMRLLVPRVVGQKTEARLAQRPARTWDEGSFLASLKDRRSSEEADVARRIFEWAHIAKVRAWWGNGTRDGSYFAMVDHHGLANWTFAVWTYGKLEIQFQHMRPPQPLGEDVVKLELLARLRAIGLEGVSFTEDDISHRPTIPLSSLLAPEKRQAFLNVWEWALATIRKS
jgi:hypothetical protein